MILVLARAEDVLLSLNEKPEGSRTSNVYETVGEVSMPLLPEGTENENIVTLVATVTALVMFDSSRDPSITEIAGPERCNVVPLSV